MDEPVISVQNLTRRFGDFVAVDHINFDVSKGEIVGYLGPNGSGKTTTLSLLAGITAPTSGTITIDGDEITRMSEDDLAGIRSAKIGFIFQSFHLIPSLTAFENVLIPMEIRGVPNATDRANELLRDVDLTDRGHHYPAELSGGEQQRVAIARAFANEPKILLADEPTGNLDSKNGRHIFDLMTGLHKRRAVTLVLVTHDHALAAEAQRQIILRDGRVVSDEFNRRDAKAERMLNEASVA